MTAVVLAGTGGRRVGGLCPDYAPVVTQWIAQHQEWVDSLTS
ncbi:hypothetical protein [Microbacterium sp. oral taxon 186]|nr:hypothetical protein [Microbacterium sp. oral taxon 186]